MNKNTHDRTTATRRAVLAGAAGLATLGLRLPLCGAATARPPTAPRRRPARGS